VEISSNYLKKKKKKSQVCSNREEELKTNTSGGIKWSPWRTALSPSQGSSCISTTNISLQNGTKSILHVTDSVAMGWGKYIFYQNNPKPETKKTQTTLAPEFLNISQQ